MPEFEFIPEKLPEFPSFMDLPWELNLDEWTTDELRLEEVQHGI